MKRATLVALLFYALQAFPQKQGQLRADSLIAELKSQQTDSAKLALLVEIMSTYSRFDRVEGLKYAEPAMKLAHTIGSKSGLGDVKNVVGRMYWRNGKFEDALKYHVEALTIFEQLKNKSKMALTIRYIGQDYGDSGNYPKALDYFNDALSRYKKTNDKQNMAYLYNLLNWVYGKMGNYVEATNNAYLTLQVYEEMGDTNGIALALADVAENYINVGNYSNALKFFIRSGQVFKERGDQINVGYNLTVIGKTHRLMRKYDESLRSYDSAISIGSAINDANVIANAYDGKAEVHKLRKEYPEALKNYLAAADLFKKYANKQDLARVYCSIGEYYRLIKEYALSRKYYDDAYALSKELKSTALASEYFRGAELLDSATSNWQDAYLNHKNYIVYRDSIYSQNNIQKLVQLQLDYEFGKREELAKAAQEEVASRQQRQMLSVGVIATLIFVIALILYRNQERQVKTNLELQQKSKSLEEENREKTSILNIVSHDLKAPLDKIHGLAEIMRMTSDLTKQEKEEYIKHIKNSIDQGTSLIRKLQEAQAASDESQAPTWQDIDVKKFVYDVQFELGGMLLQKGQTLDLKVESREIILRSDRQMLTRVLDNLISNASKFSERGTIIKLVVKTSGDKLDFMVKDQGPGLSAEDQKRLFRKFQLLTNRPTGGEGSTGLGLYITKALVEKLNGSVVVLSKPDEGTEFTVSLPMHPTQA